MASKKRIEWIDVVKGIGILLVVIGHAPRDIMRSQYNSIDVLYQFIYTFHMGIFFAISGYLYSSRKFEVKKAIKRLIIPWIIYSLCIYILFYVANHIGPISSILSNSEYSLISIKDYIIDMLLIKNPYAFHMWFIYILFIVQMIEYILDKVLNKELRANNTILVISIILYMFFYKYFLINIITKYVFYFSLGRLIRLSNIDETRRESGLTFILGIVVNLLSIYLIKRDCSDIMQSLIIFIRVFVGTSLIVVSIIQLAHKIANIKIFQYLGRNSYNIYILHQPFFCAFLGTIMLKMIPFNYFNFLFVMLVCGITGIVAPLIITRFIHLIKADNLFERLFNIKYIER